MALYKRVGANPLAGCLPIVIQIPVFFSLYKVLLRHHRDAPRAVLRLDPRSVGARPDQRSSICSACCRSPRRSRSCMIGAWPLIMGLTMFLQQKLNPQPADPMQAQMFMILPVVFTFMLSQFPAGLVIYWAWNNSLSRSPSNG